MKPLQTCLLAASAILALNGNASIYRIVSPSGTVTAEIINDGDLSWRCLLYTSPSPRDVEESRFASWGW